VITVVVLFRNAPHFAERCLQSLQLATLPDAHYLLVDDCSEAGRDVLPLLHAFRKAVAAPARILRFRRPMHYGLGLAHALSLASRSADVLFLSHDMMFTTNCAIALRQAAESGERVGIIRPTSQHMDWAKPFAVGPAAHPEHLEDVFEFSGEMRQRFGNSLVEWPMFIGDAMLIRRCVIERIGVFDPQFPTYMGDIDYGIRAARAGFRHVIARGAWLHHEGNGTAKETATAGGESVQEQGRRMVGMVEESYARFRKKWGEDHFPPHFRDMKRQHFEAVHALPGPLPGDAVIPPLTLTDDVGEFIE